MSARSWRRRRRSPELLERRLDLALEAGGMTTWLWDARADEISWDARATRIFGPRPPRTSAAWPGVTERMPFQAVHEVVGPEGDTRWLELRGEPVLDDDGELLGTAGVVVDVTAAHTAAAELAETRSALEQILDVTPAFAAEAAPEDVPGRICDAAAAVFGCDACSIFLEDGGAVRSLVCRPGELEHLLDLPVGVVDLPVLRQRLARRLPVVVDAEDGDPRLQALMRGAGMRTGVVVQLAGSLFLTLWWRDDVRHGLGPLAVVRRFADQAALALAQARTAVARREVDELNQTLQAGLLPAPLVRDPTVRVAWRYRPSEGRILLGGDFYDVVERPDGTIAYLVGDVTGHGPRPAAVGAALRAGWRALVLAVDDPAEWMRGLGTSLASYEMGPELLVTAWTGLIAGDRSSMVVSNAGHPPPVLLTPHGTDPIDVPPGIALGLAAPGEGVVTTHVHLRDRWRLLIYTDGVVEIRTGPDPADRLGLEGLAGWLRERATGTDDDALLDALVRHLETVNVKPLDDDVTVVLLGQRRPSG